MIVPQELRIGNYVRVWSEIYRVNQILPSSIIHNYNYDDINDGFEEVDIENANPRVVGRIRIKGFGNWI